MIPPTKAIAGNQYFLCARHEQIEQPRAKTTEQIANIISNSLFTIQVPARNGTATISKGRHIQCTAQIDDMQKPMRSKDNLRFLTIFLLK